MNTVTLSHANLRDGEQPRPVYIAVPQIFSYYYSEAHKATHVVSSGGAVIPVLEKPEQIKRCLETTSPTTTSSESKKPSSIIPQWETNLTDTK